MRAFKSFLLNECIILKRNIKWLPVFFFLPIGYVIAPYLNQYNLSGIHYTQNFAGVLAFCAMILGILMFSGTFSLTSTTFEKTEGMHYFLFTQGIKKLPYIMAKIVSTVSLSIVGAVIPLMIYYCAGLYQRVIISFPIVVYCILCFDVVWTLLSIIFTHIFYKISDIVLVSLSVASLLIAVLTVLIVYFRVPTLIFVLILLFTVLGVAVVAYTILNHRERKLLPFD